MSKNSDNSALAAVKERHYYILDLGEMHEPITRALVENGVSANLVKHLNPVSHWFHGNHDRSLFRPGDVVLNHVGPEDCPEGSGHRDAVESLLGVLAVPSRKLKIIHPVSVFRLDCSKVLQIQIAEQHGFKVPNTEIILANQHARDRQCLIEASKSLRFSPGSRGLFLKPSCGGTGKGVVHFNTKQELRDYVEKQSLDTLFPRPGTYLLQEDVNPDRNPLYRLEVIGGNAYYWLQIDPRYGFDLCPNCPKNKQYREKANRRMVLNPSEQHLEKSTFRIYEPANLPSHFQETERKAEKLIKAVGASNAGFEFASRVVNGQGELVLIDLNLSSNYNREAELHASTKPPLNAYDQLAKSLLAS